VVICSNRRFRIIAITGGRDVPSRRFRINALVPFLEDINIELTELCPVISAYPPSSKLLRPPWFFAALAERVTFPTRSKGYDVVILQREMISTLPTFERLLPKPWVLDVDDAIYLHRNGKAAEYMARSCSAVVCGNHYLAEKFSQWNSNVVVIPTGIDTNQLCPRDQQTNSESMIIGWIGTAGNFQYLELIEPALSKVLATFPTARLQIISNQFPNFLKHFGKQLEFIPWQPGIENDLLPQFTVGIMPLVDSEWARGKCAFKMLQYMASGVPVLASPVGVNKEIMDSSFVGFAVQNDDEWVEAISTLLQSPEMAKNIGKNGRRIVEKEYSLSVLSLKWKHVLETVVSKDHKNLGV